MTDIQLSGNLPNYAGAMVEFLNRDDGKLKRVMMYPITKIELVDLDEGAKARGPAGAVTRTLVVADDGRWVEVQ
jgi:hypothetical protein